MGGSSHPKRGFLQGSHSRETAPLSMLACFCALLAVVAQASYPPPKIQKCTEYFGSDTSDQNKLITVIDADVPSLFCGLAKLKAPCTSVHRSGPGTKCAPPSPPDKCHRY